MVQQPFSILLADDDLGDRKQIKRSLSEAKLHCTVTEAGCFEEILSACSSGFFDCALIDYQMPGKDGLEAISAIREKFFHLPIIMITGQGDELIASEAIKRGASDYIPKKSIDKESIRLVIQNALEKSRLLKQIELQHEELESFARVLVHDLRNPIMAIMYYTDFIQEEVENKSSDEIVENCKKILTSVHYINDLIDTLHSYTQTGNQVEFGKIDAGKVVEGALQNLDDLIKKRGVKVSFEMMPVINGNSPLLIQLFQNLISNGIKYCREKIPEVRIGVEELENAWQFSITDNGIGIPKDSLELVFTPFTRLHNGKEFLGTGLGLATCRKIVEKHGGRIWCESGEKGTTFFFTIPKEIDV